MSQYYHNVNDKMAGSVNIETFVMIMIWYLSIKKIEITVIKKDHLKFICKSLF